MLLRSPKDLHYPITVTELLKQPNDDVERFAPLFSYFYTSTVTEGNRYGEEFQVEKSFPTRFESETDGKLQEWKIHAGTVIAKSGYVLQTAGSFRQSRPWRHRLGLTSPEFLWLLSKNCVGMRYSLGACAPIVGRI